MHGPATVLFALATINYTLSGYEEMGDKVLKEGRKEAKGFVFPASLVKTKDHLFKLKRYRGKFPHPLIHPLSFPFLFLV